MIDNETVEKWEAIPLKEQWLFSDKLNIIKSGTACPMTGGRYTAYMYLFPLLEWLGSNHYYPKLEWGRDTVIVRINGENEASEPQHVIACILILCARIGIAEDLTRCFGKELAQMWQQMED